MVENFIKPFPEDWGYHTLQTAKLYFSNRGPANIEYGGGCINFIVTNYENYKIETIEKLNSIRIFQQPERISQDVKMYLCATKGSYCIDFLLSQKNMLDALVFKIINVIPENEMLDPQGFDPDVSLLLVGEIKLLCQSLENCSASNPYECMEKIEQVILRDYFGDGDDDSDNGAPSPLPSDELQLV